MQAISRFFGWFLWNAPLFFGAIFALFLLLGHFAANGATPPLGSTSLAIALAAFLHFRWTTYLFLIALPAFGNRPGSTQAYYFTIITSAYLLGSLLRLAWRNRRQESKSAWTVPLPLSLACVYWGASALSLLGIPLHHLIFELLARIPSVYDFSAWSWLAHIVGRSSEEPIYYIFLSLMLTTLALTTAQCIFYEISAQYDPGEAGIPYAIAILLGLLMALGVGILDYYHLINLASWRELDPLVNPGNLQFRIQSFFGHSGWYAEYITLTIPFALALLSLPLRFATRVTLIIALLLIGELNLILSFQRGGWISYPLSLLAVWAAIYVTRRLERGEQDVARALRSSILKVVISLPITLLLSFVIIYTLALTRVIPEELTPDLQVYADRFKDITKASDRSNYFRAGIKLGLLSPLIGLGSESFAYQFNREVNEPHGSYFQEISLLRLGSAHNVYLQTFSGKGILGLLLLLFVAYSVLRSSYKVCFDRARLYSLKRRILSLIAGCSMVTFLIYGNVQEIFYIYPLLFLFFGSIALSAAADKDAPEISSMITRSVGVLTLICVGFAFVFPRMYQPIRSYGCYGIERDQAGRQFRWCGPRAKVEIPEDQASAVSLVIEAAPNTRSKSKEALLQIWKGATLLSETVIAPEKKIRIPITATEGETREPLTLRTASYFIPARDIRGSKDSRVLSYRLSFEPLIASPDG